MAVDTSAGPYKNRTVMFLSSEDGHVLKVLASTDPNSTSGSTLLEDIDVYNPSKWVSTPEIVTGTWSYTMFAYITSK